MNRCELIYAYPLFEMPGRGLQEVSRSMSVVLEFDTNFSDV